MKELKFQKVLENKVPLQFCFKLFKSKQIGKMLIFDQVTATFTP